LAKTVSPHSGKVIGQEDLEVADAVFLEVVPQSVRVEDLAASCVHADEMAAFVESGVDGGVEA